MQSKRCVGILINLIIISLLCCLTACSPWEKMTSWIPFRGNEKSQYRLTDKKIEEFTRTIKSTNNTPESHYRLACFFQERKKHRLAIKEFKKALQNDPMYVKAYNGLGVSYDLLGEFPNAIKAYEAALRLNPNLAYVYNNLGYSWLLQKQLDSASKAFQQAVALDQENRQYHNNLGLAYGKQGKYDLAFNEFKLGGNEEKARRHMAQLFNQKPGMYSSETLVAENFPQDDNQDAGKEKLAQTALVDQGIREENLADSPAGNPPPQNHKQLDEPKEVAFSKNTEVSTRRSSSAEKAETLMNIHPINIHPPIQSFPETAEGIEVSNGNGVRHFAKSVAFYLGKKGFHVASLKDEPYFTIKKTTIYYCEGYLQDAYRIAKQIPQYQDMVKVSRFENRNIKVRVVVGKDMASYYKKPFFNPQPLRSL